jgi:acyl carrier protein
MSTPPLPDRIREVMAEVLEVPPASIRQDFSRADAPLWDSLNHLRLVTALEETFAVRFTMREIGELVRFDRICGAIAGRL